MSLERPFGALDDTEGVEVLPGIERKTLAYNDQIMACHFTLTAGAVMPRHSHEAAQVGYVIRGRLEFQTDDGGFEAGPGSSYSFGPNQSHGASAVEDTEVLECFTPIRQEYAL